MTAAIWALIKVIPGAIEFFKSLLGLYVEEKCAGFRTELRDALKNSLITGDQRDIEKAIGSPHAGEVVFAPGSVIVDHLPGVQ